MFRKPAHVHVCTSCRATVIPTRSNTLAGYLSRVFDRVAEAVATWRRRRNEARHMAYLDAVALNDTGLSRSALLALGADPRAWGRQERQRFPF